MKKMMPKMAGPKMPAAPRGMARNPKMPGPAPVMMANGGSVRTMSQMAGNAKSGTCGPGVSSRKK